MSAFKRINKSDIFTLPFVANKQWQFFSSSLAESGMKVYTGIKDDALFNPADDTTSGEYHKLVYRSINHLFYQQFSGSYIDNSGLLLSNNYESASIYRATGSFYDYDRWNDFNSYFPTGQSETIKVLSMPKALYSTGIKRGTFSLSSSAFQIVDDAKGNVIDIQANPVEHVGNIFYAEGLMVVTSQDYQSVFDDFAAQGDFSDDYSADFFI